MKKISIFLIALAVALIASPSAFAKTATPGWYAAAGLGVAFPNNPTIHANGTKLKAADENTALDLLGSVGYAFDNGLRLEAEYFHNQIDTKTVNNVAGGGEVTNNILFFNTFYDIETNSILTPYIGAGIGVDFVDVNNVGTPGAYLNGSTTEMAYQAIAGVTARIDESWAVTADYRYVASLDPDVNYTGGTKGHLTNASQSAIIGLRYSFCAGQAAAAPSEPLRKVEKPYVAKQLPVKALVAPVLQNYLVFFDFDKSILTPEAKKIIASAVQSYEKEGYAKIVVTGHADTSGTDAYNQALSERRALAVKAELETMGVKAADIRDAGVGEKKLLIPTTDGVREAQNRRAEIVLSK